MQKQGWYSCYLTVRVDDLCFFVHTEGFLNTVQALYHSCFVSRTFNGIQILYGTNRLHRFSGSCCVLKYIHVRIQMSI